MSHHAQQQRRFRCPSSCGAHQHSKAPLPKPRQPQDTGYHTGTTNPTSEQPFNTLHELQEQEDTIGRERAQLVVKLDVANNPNSGRQASQQHAVNPRTECTGLATPKQGGQDVVGMNKRCRNRPPSHCHPTPHHLLGHSISSMVSGFMSPFISFLLYPKTLNVVT